MQAWSTSPKPSPAVHQPSGSRTCRSAWLCLWMPDSFLLENQHCRWSRTKSGLLVREAQPTEGSRRGWGRGARDEEEPIWSHQTRDL